MTNVSKSGSSYDILVLCCRAKDLGKLRNAVSNARVVVTKTGVGPIAAFEVVASAGLSRHHKKAQPTSTTLTGG